MNRENEIIGRGAFERSFAEVEKFHSTVEDLASRRDNLTMAGGLLISDRDEANRQRTDRETNGQADPQYDAAYHTAAVLHDMFRWYVEAKELNLIVINGNGEVNVIPPPLFDIGSLPEDRRYRLVDIASAFKVSKQTIIHLIKRYGILSPLREAIYGDREVYDFRAIDFARVTKVHRLRQLGYKMGEIASIMGDAETFEAVGKNLTEAVHEWEEKPNPPNWEKLVSAIAEIPALTEPERVVLVKHYLGLGLGECAQAAGVDSEDKVRELLSSAYLKVGENIFRLFYLMGQVGGT